METLVFTLYSVLHFSDLKVEGLLQCISAGKSYPPRIQVIFAELTTENVYTYCNEPSAVGAGFGHT